MVFYMSISTTSIMVSFPELGLRRAHHVSASHTGTLSKTPFFTSACRPASTSAIKWIGTLVGILQYTGTASSEVWILMGGRACGDWAVLSLACVEDARHVVLPDELLQDHPVAGHCRHGQLVWWIRKCSPDMSMAVHSKDYHIHP